MREILAKRQVGHKLGLAVQIIVLERRKQNGVGWKRLQERLIESYVSANLQEMTQDR